MIALAAVGPWLGLGRDERSIFYLWLGLTRSDLAATGGIIFVLGLYATAVAFSRRPSILIYNTIVSLLLLEFGARAIDGRAPGAPSGSTRRTRLARRATQRP